MFLSERKRQWKLRWKCVSTSFGPGEGAKGSAQQPVRRMKVKDCREKYCGEGSIALRISGLWYKQDIDKYGLSWGN